MEKMTNKVALGFVLGLEEVKANTEVFEKLSKMLEQVEKKSKSSTSGKPTKAQLENEKIMESIVNALAEIENPIQVKELQAMEEFGEYTNQKLSALMKKLVDNGTVLRIEEKKGVTKFKLA